MPCIYSEQKTIFFNELHLVFQIKWKRCQLVLLNVWIWLYKSKRWAKVIYSQSQLVLHYFPSIIENRKWKDSWKNICTTLQSHCVDFTVPDPFPSYAISFWQDVNMLYFSGLGNIHIWCQVYFQPFTSDILRLF